MVAKILKFFFKKFGLDVKRYSIAQNQTARMMKIISEFDINVVFDVGANTGQFGTELRTLNYKGEIISFEPLEHAYKVLCKTASSDSLWKPAIRTAIGDIDAEIEINVAGNSASSSILDMMDSHISAAPTTAPIGVEKVPIHRLDTLSGQYLKSDSQLFVKIDTQGYENSVLNGAVETIARAKVLQVELSLIELYAGQKLLMEMIEKIKNMGFELWGLEPAFVDSNTGRMLQVDAVFCRK